MSVSSVRSSMDSVRSTSPAPSVQSVPDKLAPPMAGSMVWEGNGLQGYVVTLKGEEVLQIWHAVAHFKLLELPLSDINKSNFQLSPELADKLAELSKQVHKGPGVAVLRGIDRANFNDTQSVIAFAGICSYVCPLRATDAYANQTLSHVRDATHDTVPRWAKNIGLAGSKTPTQMEFHSDRFSGDVLALHVRNDGGRDRGGDQYVVSFGRIYNELLKTDPAVLETMAAPDWPFELKQKDGEPYLELGPTLFFSQGKPMVQLVKAPLLGSPLITRDASMPTLTTEQVHALDAVEKLAKQFCTKLDRQNGDIQFVNNLSIMHARSAYGSKGQRSNRHLLRMFLRDPENEWEKPARYRNKFDDPFVAGRRQELPVVDLDPWRKISGRDSHG